MNRIDVIDGIQNLLETSNDLVYITTELIFDQINKEYNSLNIESYGLYIECIKIVCLAIEYHQDTYAKSGFEDFNINKCDIDNIKNIDTLKDILIKDKTIEE